MLPGKRLRLKAYLSALLWRQNLTSVGELRCSKQPSWLPKQVTMPDCTSCSWVLRPRLSKDSQARDRLSLTETPRLSTKTKCLGPMAPSCLIPAAKVAGEARSFMMRDPVASRLLVKTPAIPKEVHLRIIIQHAPFQVRERESSLANTVSTPKWEANSSSKTYRWKLSWMSSSRRLSSILSSAECQAGLPSSTSSGKHTSIRAIASEEQRLTPGGDTNDEFTIRASRIRRFSLFPSRQRRRCRGSVSQYHSDEVEGVHFPANVQRDAASTHGSS